MRAWVAPQPFPRSDDNLGRIGLGRCRAPRADLAAPAAAWPAAARARVPLLAWRQFGHGSSVSGPPQWRALLSLNARNPSPAPASPDPTHYATLRAEVRSQPGQMVVHARTDGPFVCLGRARPSAQAGKQLRHAGLRARAGRAPCVESLRAAGHAQANDAALGAWAGPGPARTVGLLSCAELGDDQRQRCVQRTRQNETSCSPRSTVGASSATTATPQLIHSPDSSLCCFAESWARREHHNLL